MTLRLHLLKTMCQLAHNHGHIVGASPDGSLDHVPTWMFTRPKDWRWSNGWIEDVRRAWLDGFIKGGDKYLNDH